MINSHTRFCLYKDGMACQIAQHMGLFVVHTLCLRLLVFKSNYRSDGLPAPLLKPLPLLVHRNPPK